MSDDPILTFGESTSEANVATNTAIDFARNPVSLETEKSRARSMRYRRRRDAGEICVLIQLPRAELEDVLIDGGYLGSHLADDRDAVQAATETFVRDAVLDGVNKRDHA